MISENRSRLQSVQIALLCAVAFLSPLVAGKLAPIPDFAIQVLVLLAGLTWVIRSVGQRSIGLPGGWVLGSLIAFSVMLGISAWHSASLYLTIRQLLNFGSYILIFLMVAGLSADRRDVYRILGVLGISSMLVGVLGVREYMLSGGGGWRVFSTFLNPDFLAGFAAMTLPVVLGWYMSRTSVAISVVSGLAVLYLLGNVLISGSRFGAATAVVGVIVTLVLAVCSGNLRKAQALRIVLVIIPMIFVYLMLSRPLTARVASTKAEAHSGGFRISTWMGTAHMAEANPTHGTGLGTFEVAYPRYALTGYTKLAHNTYIQIAGETGIPAALALIILLASSVFPPMLATIRRRINPEMELVGPSDAARLQWTPEPGLIMSGLAGGAVASMARNLVDSDWYVAAIGIGFWIILGAAIAVGNPGGVRPFRVTRPWGLVAGVALAAVTLGALSMLAGEITAAVGLSRWSTDPEATLTSYRLAMKLDPLNADLHRRVAMADLTLAEQFAEPSYSDDAVHELGEAARLEPGNAKTYYQLARVYGFYPDEARAIEWYKQALDCNPNAPEIMLALGRAYQSAGRGNDALKTWKRMVAVENSPYGRIRAVPEMVEPEYIFAHSAIGMDLERRGDKAGAVREYKVALDRIARYQDSVKGMKAIMEANGRRDSRMEQDVLMLQLDLVERVKGYSGGSIR